MKQFLSWMLAVVILLSLCGCSKVSTSEPPATTMPTTTVSIPIHHHTYRDADCTTPKTCTDCGYTRGSALGHNYVDGICDRCGETDTTYLPLTGSEWTTVSLSENGSQLELITMAFQANSCTISAIVYYRLSDVPMDQWTDAMRNEKNWYDYGGEIYYRKQKLASQSLSFITQSNTITCEMLEDDTVVGTLILERIAGNKLSITYFEGAFHVQFMNVGDVLGGTMSSLS